MAFDFPASPTTGQTYQVSGGPTYVYNGTAWQVLTPGSRFNRTTFTATAGQTTFSVNYLIGGVDVFRNGVKLVNVTDFTATNGTSVVLADGCTAGDTVEIVSYAQVNYTNAMQRTGDTMTGDLIFSGTGRRVKGDFSNNTLSSRVAFQTTTANNATAPLIIPNGTGSTAGVIGFNSSDPDNASFFSLLAVGSTDVRLSSGATGTGTNRPMTFYTGGSERVRIDTSGNVGIGTSSPTNALQVVGTVKASAELYVGSNADDNYSGGVQNLSNTSRSIAIHADPNNSGASSFLSFNVDGTEQARITTAGNFLTGTTGSSAGKITAISAGADSQNGLYAEVNSKTSSGSYGVHGRSNVTSTYSSGGVMGMSINANTYGISGYWSGSAYFSFYGNGNSFVSGTWQTSDARLKENVETIESALNTITALRPVAFDWKQNSDAARNGLSHDYGLIAQEVLPILPDIVQEIDAPLVSEDMTPSLNNELGSFYTIEYSRLIPHLIAAVQELKTELDAAKARIAALEGAA